MQLSKWVSYNFLTHSVYSVNHFSNLLVAPASKFQASIKRYSILWFFKKSYFWEDSEPQRSQKSSQYDSISSHIHARQDLSVHVKFMGCSQTSVAPLICHVHFLNRSRHYLKGACQVTISLVACKFHESKRVLIHICIPSTQNTLNKCRLNKNTQFWTTFYNCSLNSLPVCYQFS